MFRHRNLFRGSLPRTLTKVYPHNAAQNGVVSFSFADVVNSGDEEAYVYLFVVPNGEVADWRYAKAGGSVVPARGSYQWTGFEIMETTGDSIWAYGTGGSLVSLTCNGGALL